MATLKKFLAGVTTCMFTFGVAGGINVASFAADELPEDATVSSSQSNIKTENQTVDGKEYTVQWNTEDDSIKILDSAGNVLGSTTMNKVKTLYAEKVGAQNSSGTTSKPGMVASGPNACSVTLGAAGIANSVLWTAAGLTAVAPPAAIAAAGGGLLTITIITVGSMWC